VSTSSQTLSSPNSPTVTPVYRVPAHPLFDRRLLEKNLKIIVNGGGYKGKEVTAVLKEDGGRFSICWHHYRTWKPLDHEWVTPKYPALRDNGLLVVIRGEHCGKYVRRIYHRYVNEEEFVISAAVINGVGSGSPSLSGQQIEVPSSDLCVSCETKEEKLVYDNMMSHLRESARKIRAK